MTTQGTETRSAETTGSARKGDGPSPNGGAPDHPDATDYRNRAERAEAECKELREALRRIEEGDYPRPVGTQWMPDRPSKHDRCTHGAWMYETCEGCLDSFVRATLGS